MSEAAPPPQPPAETPIPVAIDQLRAMAGAGPSDKEFVVRGANTDIRVSYNGVLAQSIYLSAPFPSKRGAGGGAYRGERTGTARGIRPLLIQLSKESKGDRKAKARGVNREIQTGDPAFDSEVYIDDNGAGEDAVRGVFAHEDVRAAALALIREDTTFFNLDDVEGNVTVCFTISHGAEKDGQRAARMVEAFDKLMVALPALEGTGRVRVWSGWPVIAAILGPPIAGAAAVIVTTPARCRAGAHDVLLHCGAGSECCGPVGWGAAGGLAGAGLIAVGVVLKLRGRADSTMMRRFWITFATILSLEVAILVARLLW